VVSRRPTFRGQRAGGVRGRVVQSRRRVSHEDFCAQAFCFVCFTPMVAHESSAPRSLACPPSKVRAAANPKGPSSASKSARQHGIEG